MRRRLTIMATQFLMVWAIGLTSALGQTSGEAPAQPAVEIARPRCPSPWTGPNSSGRAWNHGTRRGRRSAKMDWLLKQWEQQSSRLKTLDVTILRIDDTPAWGDLEYYEGRALFKSPNLAFIDFNKIQQDDKKKPIKDPQKNKFVSTPHERIICTGNEVWQYKSDTQQIFIFPLEKDEQKKAIEEGPLPFLFNMRR